MNQELNKKRNFSFGKNVYFPFQKQENRILSFEAVLVKHYDDNHTSAQKNTRIMVYILYRFRF